MPRSVTAAILAADDRLDAASPAEVGARPPPSPITSVTNRDQNRRLAAILAADVAGYAALMRADEADTHARVKQLWDRVVAPMVQGHRGRIVKFMGDGALAEFASAVDAVRCAVAIQRDLAARADSLPLRIGINVGDVIVDGDDLYGDGVNVAARVQEAAPPGGVCMSDDAQRQARGKLDAAFADGGERSLKNIPEPVRVWTWAPDAAAAAPGADAPALEQEIRFCRSSDGARIAYATVGTGPPLLKTSNWLTHLELDWTSPLWHDLLVALARDHRLVRYDHRGTGLSDWQVDTLTFEAWLEDLEAVVAAAGLGRFDIFGISQGCAAAIAFAARHPEMVGRLVLMGGFPKGWRLTGHEGTRRQWEALNALAREGWGRENPAFRQLFTALFAPTASAEQKAWLDDIQRASASPENAVRVIEAFGDIDVSALLEKIDCPTLVLHCRGDEVVPFDAGRALAARIPDARFVPLESRNHALFPTDPAWRQAVAEVGRFLGKPPGAP